MLALFFGFAALLVVYLAAGRAAPEPGHERAVPRAGVQLAGRHLLAAGTPSSSAWCRSWSYAGAIMVLFLFVIMLLNAGRRGARRRQTGAVLRRSACRQRLGLGILLTLVLVRHDAANAGGSSCAMPDSATARHRMAAVYHLSAARLKSPRPVLVAILCRHHRALRCWPGRMDGAYPLRI
jgi:hypothetical protein